MFPACCRWWYKGARGRRGAACLSLLLRTRTCNPPRQAWAFSLFCERPPLTETARRRALAGLGDVATHIPGERWQKQHRSRPQGLIRTGNSKSRTLQTQDRQEAQEPKRERFQQISRAGEHLIPQCQKLFTLGWSLQLQS